MWIWQHIRGLVFSNSPPFLPPTSSETDLTKFATQTPYMHNTDKSTTTNVVPPTTVLSTFEIPTFVGTSKLSIRPTDLAFGSDVDVDVEHIDQLLFFTRITNVTGSLRSLSLTTAKFMTEVIMETLFITTAVKMKNETNLFPLFR